MITPTLTAFGQVRRSLDRNHFSQTRRIARSRHTGRWIVEEVNTVYGYWATIGSDLSEDWVQKLLARPTYLGPKCEAEEAADKSTLCG